LQGSLRSLFVVTLLVGATAGCQRTAPGSRESRAVPTLGATGATGATDAGPTSPTVSSGFPVSTRPEKDFFTEPLLRTLAKEASAIVVCRLLNLVDSFPGEREPDIFYDATCEVLEVIAGSPKGTPLHFIWQVERDNPMPRPDSELLVYLKARKEPLDGPPSLKWVALDTGVMGYTPALRDRIHHCSTNPQSLHCRH